MIGLLVRGYSESKGCDRGLIQSSTFELTNLSCCLQLLDEYILDLEHFEVSLLIKTKGKRCHVILNTVSGPDICSTIRCLARHGRFIQLAQADLTRNKGVGKTKYKKCIHYY